MARDAGNRGDVELHEDAVVMEPFDLPAPVVAEEPAAKRMPWWVGAGIVVVMLAVAGAVIVFVGGGNGLPTGEPRVDGHETVAAVGQASPADAAAAGAASGGLSADAPADETDRSPSGGGTDAGDQASPGSRAATEILDVSWARSKDLTLVRILANGELTPGRVDGSLLEKPARYLMRIRGIGEPYVPEVIVPGLGSPERIRVGYHPELTPPQIHVVLDLADGDREVTWAIVGGDAIEIELAHPSPAP